jgi:hypothetical protein
MVCDALLANAENMSIPFRLGVYCQEKTLEVFTAEA